MANYQQVTLPFCTPVPFNFPLSGHEDCLIKVTGHLGNGGQNVWFCINVQSGPGLPSYGPSMGGDIFLHLRPDITNRMVVRMNRLMGNWGAPNQPDATPFPLVPGSSFEVMILLPASSVSVPSMCRIAMNGAHFAEYALPSVLPSALFASIEADPSVTITSLQSFNIPSQAPPPQSAGYPNLASVPHPMPVPNFPAPYPQGASMSGPGYAAAPGQPSSSSNSMFNKVLGTAAALPLVGGALAAATHLPFAGKKLGKKMHKAGLGGGVMGGHKSGGHGYPGLGTGAAGLAVGALGAYALTKQAKKMKKGFKFGHGSSSSSSSSSDSD